MILLLLFAFVAGAATVISPCILPVLPILLAGSTQGGNKLRPLGIALGLASSFTILTLILNQLVLISGISAEWMRGAAIILISLFGLTLLFPSLGEKFALLAAPLANWGSIPVAKNYSPFWQGFLLGALLGFLWTPCAGPILATVITLAAIQQISWQVIVLSFSYSLGCALPIFLLAYGGQRALESIGILRRHSEGIRRCFGALVLLMAASLALHVESYLQLWTLQYMPYTQVDDIPIVDKYLQKLHGGAPTARTTQDNGRLPNYGPAPELVGISQWINSPPLTLAQLKGKVVLIDFWTYSCINCIRTLPYLIHWYNSYKDKGFELIGVHTPEFAFEKNGDNVKAATERFGIPYPVAMDNAYATWQAFNNYYWPAHYLIDQQGNVRYVHYGEHGYLETENAIRDLLGLKPLAKESIEDKGSPTHAITAETYLGYARAEHYVQTIEPDATATYQASGSPDDGQVMLSGPWHSEKERITAAGPNATLTLKFKATHVYLVLSSPERTEIKVLLDGKDVPKSMRTADMDPKGNIIVQEPRKYDIVAVPYGIHTVTLILPPDVSAYAFTFG